MPVDIDVEGTATFVRGLLDGGCTQAASTSYRPQDVVAISISQADGGTTTFEYVVPEDAGFGGRNGEWARVTYKVDDDVFNTPPSTFWIQDDAGTVIARFVGRTPSTVKLSPQMTLTFTRADRAACASCEWCAWYDSDLDVAVDGGGALRIPFRSSARVGEWLVLHNGSPMVRFGCDPTPTPHQAIVFNRVAPP